MIGYSPSSVASQGITYDRFSKPNTQVTTCSVVIFVSQMWSTESSADVISIRNASFHRGWPQCILYFWKTLDNILKRMPWSSAPKNAEFKKFPNWQLILVTVQAPAWVGIALVQDLYRMATLVGAEFSSSPWSCVNCPNNHHDIWWLQN